MECKSLKFQISLARNSIVRMKNVCGCGADPRICYLGTGKSEVFSSKQGERSYCLGWTFMQSPSPCFEWLQFTGTHANKVNVNATPEKIEQDDRFSWRNRRNGALPVG